MDLLNDLTPNIKIAPKKLRVVAALIDMVIYLTLGYLIGLLFGMSFNNAEGFGFHLTGLPAILFCVLWLPLIPICEGLTGRTIGKWILKIKVVRQDQSPTNIGASLIRHLFDIIDLFLLIGLIVASSNANSQRIGDLVAKTYVVMND